MRAHRVFPLPILTMAIMGSLHAEAVSNPRLFFSNDDLPQLREKIDHPELRPVWEDLLMRAEGFVTPGHRYYRDPADILVPVQGARSAEHRMLQAGRHLAIWGETLGPAAMLTGDARYGRHGAALTVAMAKVYRFVPERHGTFMTLSHGELLRGLALGYDFFSPFMTEEERGFVAEVARDYLTFVLDQAREGEAWWYPASNHLAVSVGAAGCAAIAIEDRYPREADAWIDGSHERIATWLETSFDERGGYSEGASYVEYAMVNVALFSHALARRSGPELYRHPHVAAIPRFLAMSLVPGTFQTEARNSASFSDSFATPWIQRLAAINNDGLARWLWDNRNGRQDYPFVQLDHSDSRGLSFFRILWHNDVSAATPEETGLPLNLLFPGRGLCIWRTGWEESDVMFSIEAGRYYNVTHNQSDEGHFNLYAYGHRWATDPGADNRRVPESAAQAVAHSLVFVDGKGQAISGSGVGTDGEIIAYRETDRYSYALADATEAYNRNVAAGERRRVPGKGPDDLAAGVRHAHRHALFVRPDGGALPYAVVIDDIQKDDRERLYTWQMVTYEEHAMRFDGNCATVWPSAEAAGSANSPRLEIFVAASAPVVWHEKIHDFGIERNPRRIRQMRANAETVNPYFFAILLPLPAGADRPDVLFAGDGRSAAIRWAGREDRISWKGHGIEPEMEFRR